MKLSVTSVALPDLDLVETCTLLSELGYDGVEWRVRYTPEEKKNGGYDSPWGAHKSDLSPANLASKADEVKRITADAGLGIAGIASNLRADELEDIKLLSEGVAKLGEVPVRIGAPRRYDRTVPYPELFEEAVEAYGRAIEITKGSGLKMLVEIHGGTIFVSTSLAHRLVSHFSPKDIGVIYDVNNMAKDGFETFRIGLELLGPYLAHSHAGGCKPVSGDTDKNGTVHWEYEACDLAEGILDIPQLIKDFRAVDYDGFISIEDFRSIPHRERLSNQIRYLKKLI